MVSQEIISTKVLGIKFGAKFIVKWARKYQIIKRNILKQQLDIHTLVETHFESKILHLLLLNLNIYDLAFAYHAESQ